MCGEFEGMREEMWRELEEALMGRNEGIGCGNFRKAMMGRCCCYWKKKWEVHVYGGRKKQ